MSRTGPPRRPVPVPVPPARLAPVVRGLVTLCALPFAALLLLIVFPLFVAGRATVLAIGVFERCLPDPPPPTPHDPLTRHPVIRPSPNHDRRSDDSDA